MATGFGMTTTASLERWLLETGKVLADYTCDCDNGVSRMLTVEGANGVVFNAIYLNGKLLGIGS